ncbi:Phage protein D [Actinobacillus equuli]|nr:Phage protein D [Actinobacillus equuli]
MTINVEFWHLVGLLLSFLGCCFGFAKILVAQFQSAGNITVVGNPELVAGATIHLRNLGVFSGKYLIKSSRHSFGRNTGYTTEIEVRMLEFIADDLATLAMENSNADT